MDANEIKLTIAAEDVYRLVKEIKLREAELNHTQLDLEVDRRDFEAYKAAQAEREADIRAKVEQDSVKQFGEYTRRMKVLELNERRVEAFREYITTEGLCLNAIKSVLEKRITKSDRAKIEKEQKRINDAWEKFDAVQKQIAKDAGVAPWELDICKSEMPPACKDAVCEDCAAKMGKVPVARPVGHWTGYCDFCGQEKSLSSLRSDYVDKEGANE